VSTKRLKNPASGYSTTWHHPQNHFARNKKHFPLPFGAIRHPGEHITLQMGLVQVKNGGFHTHFWTLEWPCTPGGKANHHLIVHSTPQIVTKRSPNETFWADWTVSAGFLGENPTLRRLLLRTVGGIFRGCDPFSGC
jgi:hypothetical protein